MGGVIYVGWGNNFKPQPSLFIADANDLRTRLVYDIAVRLGAINVLHRYIILGFLFLMMGVAWLREN